MLYCDKHPKSFSREGLVKIMFHAIIRAPLLIDLWLTPRYAIG